MAATTYTITSLKKRLFAFLGALTFIFCGIVARLGYLQLIAGRSLQLKAADQWTRDLPLTPKRGLITDRNGVTLVNNNTSYSVYFRASAIKDAVEVATFVANKLAMPYETVYNKAVNFGVSEVTVARQVPKETADEIRLKNFAGVYFAEDITRNYVYGDFLTQVLGYTSIDNVGQSGLEQYYDKILRGIEGEIMTETDIKGVPIEGGNISYLPAIDGLSIELTIDSVIQRVTENVLDVIMRAHKPSGARIIVMDPKTGEILAMGSKPSYDLNSVPRDDIDTLLSDGRNMLVMDIYEPGSTFKILTVSANAEEYIRGNKYAFSPDHIFRNNANFRLVDGGKKISCWTNHNNGKHHNQTLTEALNHSCNPIFTDIAMALGKDTMYDYIKAFGYGSKLGIDFTGEGSGMLIPQNLATAGDLARIGFGQSIAVTPLQLITATAASINGGYLMQPHLVRKISGDGVSYSIPAVVKGRPISSAASKLVRDMMVDVVTNGSGKQAYLAGYGVGGKTGTAQKFENGSIAQGKYVSSFVGFFPANDPQYIALVVVDEPVGQSYGSIVAAPYAKQLFEQIIYYKNLKPSM